MADAKTPSWECPPINDQGICTISTQEAGSSLAQQVTTGHCPSSKQSIRCMTYKRGEGGGFVPCQFVVANFAVGNLAEPPGLMWFRGHQGPPRTVVVCRALQAQWSLAIAENAGETHLPHSTTMMRVKLVSGPDTGSNVETGNRLTPQVRATVTPCKVAPGSCSFLFMGVNCLLWPVFLQFTLINNASHRRSK